MDEGKRATILYTQELLVTLVKRLAAAGIISESGAKALATEVAESAKQRAPELAEHFDVHATKLVEGIAAEVASKATH